MYDVNFRVFCEKINNLLFSTCSSFPRGRTVNEQIAWLLSGVGGARASDHSDSKSSFSFVNDSHELEPMKIKFFFVVSAINLCAD